MPNFEDMVPVNPTQLLMDDHIKRMEIVITLVLIQLVVTLLITFGLKLRIKKEKRKRIIILVSLLVAFITYFLTLWLAMREQVSCYWGTGFFCVNSYLLNLLVGLTPFLLFINKKDRKKR